MNNHYLTLTFSSIGHAFMHMFAAFYFVIVLAIESSWELSYDELIKLWSLGALLVGLGALPAGWLSDKWSRSSMMVIMFFGMGFSSILCGLSNDNTFLFFSLSILGLFCSIYHPVGIAWVVNSSKKKGKALGINGIFGGVGIGLGAFIAGTFVEYFGWRSAFIIPGIISILLSLIVFILIFKGLISYKNIKSIDLEEKHSTNNLIVIAIILLISMFGIGLTFQILQTSIPKILDMRINNISTFQIGFTIAIIYCLTGAMTIIGGLLADRYSLKIIYVAGIVAQVPCYFFIASFSGMSLIVVCLLAMLFNSSILPAENILLAKFTPEQHHGLIYGVKFIVAFGAAPLGVYLVAKSYELTFEFNYLFIFVSFVMALIGLLTLFLPIKSLSNKY